MSRNNPDVRMINLYKLHIPKTKSFEYLAGRANENPGNHKYYFTMGSYDIIDVVEVPIKQNGEHVLSQVHSFAEKVNSNEEAPKVSADILRIKCKEFSCQKLFVFTDADEEKQKKIENFWEPNGIDNNDDHLFFMSMLHINDYDRKGVNGGRVDLYSIVNHIEDCYDGMNYLYYFTFDYSDIVIFCKTKSLDKYLDAVSMLNYQSRGKKIVLDSFTMYGICRKYMLEQFEIIDDALKSGNIESGITMFFNENDSSEFFLKINIGVQNYQTLEYFKSKLETLSEYCSNAGKRIKINQLGRHDFSIINEKATLKWLILTEYLIDLCTTVGTDTSDLKGIFPNDQITDADVFWTFEAYIGNEEKKYLDVRAPGGAGINNKKLKELCEKFQHVLKEKYHNAANYYLPVNEVENSIRSIAKNRFAEDFILCMYESFHRFVNYMTEKAEIADKGPYLVDEYFDRTFNYYFRGLTALTNSGMHADRSFIQATAFNAVFYDIPPKLMSLYTAVVYRLISILKDEDKYEYAFLFVPNFSNDIIVETISYPQIKPENRLFLVSINEGFFYDPPSVISTMIHEVAHFAGDKKRCRRDRAERYIKCIVYYVLSKTLPKQATGVNKYMLDLIDGILDVMRKQLVLDNEEYLYSKHSRELIWAVCRIMLTNSEIDSIVNNYINGCSNDNWIDRRRCNYPVDNRTEYIFEQYKINLNDITNANKDENDMLNKRLDIVQLLFTEAYADLQMVILLRMSFKEYIRKFVDDEKLTPQKLILDQYVKRIAVVSKVMIDMGLWKSEIVKNDVAGSDYGEFYRKLSDNINQIAVQMDNNVPHQEFMRNLRKDYIEFCRKCEDKFVPEEPKLKGEKPAVYISGMMFNIQIYIYLAHTLKEFISCKDDKIGRIIRLRAVYSDIKSFNNIFKTYSTIREEIEKYKQDLIDRL